MTAFGPAQAAQSIYDFWARVIPGFLGQFGAAANAQSGASSVGGDGSAFPLNLLFPADQWMKAAASAPQSLQALARSFVGAKAQKILTPTLADWFKSRS